MAYLLERGLFMAINKPTFHRKPPLSSSLSSYPNAQQILNRKLLTQPDPEPAMASRKQHDKRTQPRFYGEVREAA